jgi:hypothetical protein
MNIVNSVILSKEVFAFRVRLVRSLTLAARAPTAELIALRYE